MRSPWEITVDDIDHERRVKQAKRLAVTMNVIAKIRRRALWRVVVALWRLDARELQLAADVLLHLAHHVDHIRKFEAKP